MSGWIKLHRKLLDHWVYEDPEVFKLWVTMLMNAAYQPTREMVGQTEVQLECGQLVFGRKTYADITGIHPEKVRRVIDRFIAKDMITRVATSSRYSIIQINNYELYQQQGNQQIQPANNQLNNQQQMVSNRRFSDSVTSKQPAFQPASQPSIQPAKQPAENGVNTSFAEFGNQQNNQVVAQQTDQQSNQIYKNIKKEKNIVLLPTADLENTPLDDEYDVEAFHQGLDIIQRQAAVTISPSQVLRLRAYRDDLPGEVIRYACQQAEVYGITGRGVVAYVTSILDRYIRNGITTLDAAIADTEKYQRAKEKEEKPSYEEYNWRGSNRNLAKLYEEELRQLREMQEEEERKRKLMGES